MPTNPGAVTLDAAPGFADALAMHGVARLVSASWVAGLILASGCAGGTPADVTGPVDEPSAAEPPGMGVDREIFGLVGQVMEPHGTPVVQGTVYLVPASDVEALAASPIDLFLSPEETSMADNDEPIEDLVDLLGPEYEQAAVDDGGFYRFETLPEGNLFVVWFPDPGVTEYFPGGDYSRASFANTSLIGMQLDIRVSARPTAEARYLGSSTCLLCHDLQTTAATAHSVGLQVPGVRSPLQDITPWPDFDQGLEAFEAGITLFYFDCDPSADGSSPCSVLDVLPVAPVSFEIALRRDSSVPLGEIGAFYIEIVNRVNAEPPRRYDVVLTYGGALFKQQYLARRTNPNGSFSYFLLPIQCNYQGDFENPDPDDWPWRDYRSDLWFNFASGTLTEPPNQESFDNNCAGCHFTGYELSGNEGAGWSASAVRDGAGAFDYDGDGRTDLINVGCEACHGPGSDHVERVPVGRYIVSPGSLTPGRAAMLCGGCHSRPVGIGAGMTGLPLSVANQMPPPGIRRADFAIDNTTRVGGAPSDFFNSGDPFAHYQQYSGYLQSTHYRNPNRIPTCTGCHDPHANFDDVYGPAVSQNLNAVCVVCHNEEPFLFMLDHVQQVTGFSHDSITREFRCTECHMVPTAKSGASVPALLDMIPNQDPPVQYYWNDIAAHRMTTTGRDAYQEQPIAATNRCAPCHGGFFPNQ